MDKKKSAADRFIDELTSEEELFGTSLRVKPVNCQRDLGTLSNNKWLSARVDTLETEIDMIKEKLDELILFVQKNEY